MPHPHLNLAVPHRIVGYSLLAGGAVATAALGLASYASGVLNKPNRETGTTFAFSPWEVQVPHEPVAFQTADGITLRGWWFPRDETRRVVIGLTGHRGVKQDLLGIGSALWRAGNNVLLFDFRACGESDPAPLSLAHYELSDVRAAIAHVRNRVPEARIVLVGYSMGASLAILAAAEDPAIDAVVADSPFATVSDLVATAYRRRRLPVRPLVALTDAFNRCRYGYRFSAVRPLDAVSAIAPRPLFLIHGTEDRVVPVQHTHDLALRAASDTQTWILPGIRHCGAYFADRERYVERVAAFVGRSFAEAEANT